VAAATSGVAGRAVSVSVDINSSSPNKLIYNMCISVTRFLSV
jgi:hypothetical protein